MEIIEAASVSFHTSGSRPRKREICWNYTQVRVPGNKIALRTCAPIFFNCVPRGSAFLLPGASLREAVDSKAFCGFWLSLRIQKYPHIWYVGVSIFGIVGMVLGRYLLLGYMDRSAIPLRKCVGFQGVLPQEATMIEGRTSWQHTQCYLSCRSGELLGLLGISPRYLDWAWSC